MTYRTEDPAYQAERAIVGLAHRAWQAAAVLGVLSVLLGIAMRVWPHETLRAAGVLFGLYLLFSGALQLIGAFGTHLSAGLRVLGFLSGALSILLGALCFRSELGSVVLLAVWIGVGWLFRGLTQLVAAISDRGMPARGWQGLSGLIVAIGGLVLIDSPLHSVSVLVLVAGWWLIALGAMELFTALRLRREIPAVAPQTAELR
jgi:uncharacterized membrane protein HdeD (DUF308 family)